MKTSELSLSFLATFTTFLATAAPLPSTCQCATPLPTSVRSISQPRLLASSSLCEVLCEFVSENLALNLKETEVRIKRMDLDALPAPIDTTEHPLPTSVLMQLSSQSESKPSAPSRTATPTLYHETSFGEEKRLGEHINNVQARARAQIDGFEQRHLLVILLGLLALFLVAVAIVESVEQLWKRSGSLYPGRGRIMLVDGWEGLVAQYQESDELYDEKRELLW